jgi:hypothetical protein
MDCLLLRCLRILQQLRQRIHRAHRGNHIIHQGNGATVVRQGGGAETKGMPEIATAVPGTQALLGGGKQGAYYLLPGNRNAQCTSQLRGQQQGLVVATRAQARGVQRYRDQQVRPLSGAILP